MKTKLLILITLFLSFSVIAVAQKKVDIKEKTEKKVTNRVNKKSDELLDKGLDKIEKGIGSLFKRKKKKKKKKKRNEEVVIEQQEQASTPETPAQPAAPAAPKVDIKWSRFDFVPGDEVLFEDAPDLMEENGEFPSRWDLQAGNCEIVNVNGENVIAFPQGGTITPYLTNAKEDYIPEVFTVEFDAYFRPEYARRIYLYLWDKKNHRSNGNSSVSFNVNSASLNTGNYSGSLPGKKGNYSKEGGWRHFSVAFTKGKLKVYVNDTRLINIPRYSANPSGISIQVEGYSSDKPEDLQYIKNVRIAKGGVKYYDRIMQDGKIVCNGIRFDVNKATLKPESMGPINKIFQLMTKKTDLRFSVEGHTDADGDDAKNLSLSEQRAKTVMDKLISMGITADRLSSKGLGESKPVDNNNSPEGKANNRRVEFVKL
jgi:hypothetical protein